MDAEQCNFAGLRSGSRRRLGSDVRPQAVRSRSSSFSIIVATASRRLGPGISRTHTHTHTGTNRVLPRRHANKRRDVSMERIDTTHRKGCRVRGKKNCKKARRSAGRRILGQAARDAPRRMWLRCGIVFSRGQKMNLDLQTFWAFYARGKITTTAPRNLPKHQGLLGAMRRKQNEVGAKTDCTHTEAAQ